MKLYREPSTESLQDACIRLGDTDALTLALEKDSYMYGVLLARDPYEKELLEKGFHEPEFSLILTTIPAGAWDCVYRASFTIPSNPGSLSELINRLNNKNIRVRDVRTGSGLNLNTLSLYSKDLGFKHAPAKSKIGNDHFLSRVDILLEFINKPVRGKEEEELKKVQKKGKIKLETLFHPLSGLRRLSYLWEYDDIIASRVRLPVVSKKGGHYIDISSWSDMPIRRRKDVPSKRMDTVIDLAPYLIVGYTDSVEQLALWHFYTVHSENRVLFRFDIDIPADRVEHYWYNRIYTIFSKYKVDVICSFSSSRLAGSYRRLHITAAMARNNSSLSSAKMFNELASYDEKEHEEIQRIQDKVYRYDNGSRSKFRGESARWRSRIRNLRSWETDPELRGIAFKESWDPNPFIFTSPYNKDQYCELIGIEADAHIAKVKKSGENKQGKQHETETNLGRSRLVICNEIVQLVNSDEPRSVTLIGPYRGGKTSMMNMVSEELKNDGAIPVHIGMDVKEPGDVLSIIEEAMENKSREITGGNSTKLMDVKKLISEIRRIYQKISLSGTIKIPGFEFEIKENNGDQASNVLSDASRIKDTVSALKVAIEKIEELGPKSRIVFLIDEGVDIDSWSDTKGLSGWRSVLESPRNRNIRWLVGANIPLGMLDKSSPLGNVFHEVNLGPFTGEECEAILDKYFYLPSPGYRNTSMRRNADAPTPTPLAFLSRDAAKLLMKATAALPYLFQVSCFHLYDFISRARFKAIGAELIEHVLLHIVLSNLSDYFNSEWNKLPENVKNVIVKELPEEPVSLIDRDTFREQRKPLVAFAVKALQRSGIGDGLGYINPLAFIWMATQNFGTHLSDN